MKIVKHLSSNKKILENGFLKTKAVVFEEGVYELNGKDFGINKDKISVFYPLASFADEEALESLKSSPVIEGHESITTENSDKVVGNIFSTKTSRKKIVTDFIITNQKIIDKINKNDLSEVSVSIKCDLKESKGSYFGKEHDYFLDNVSYQHVGLLGKGEGRMGESVSILNSNQDKIEIKNEGEVEAVSTLQEAEVEVVGVREEAKETSNDSDLTSLKSENESLQKQIEELKQKSSDEALELKAKEIAEVKADFDELSKALGIENKEGEDLKIEDKYKKVLNNLSLNTDNLSSEALKTSFNAVKQALKRFEAKKASINNSNDDLPNKENRVDSFVKRIVENSLGTKDAWYDKALSQEDFCRYEISKKLAQQN